MLEIFKSGGPVMYPLLACSVIVLSVVIERVMFWIRLGIGKRKGRRIERLPDPNSRQRHPAP